MTLAARYLGDRRLDVVEVEPAPPGLGEVQVSVAYTGICGTDLHIYHGAMDARVDTPAVLGHEMSGRVAAVGDGVEGWTIGDAVTVMPLLWCGTCPACRSGASHICHRLTFMGIDSAGSMQQRWNVAASTLVRLPAGLDLAVAALAEPTAVAVHDVRRGGVAGGRALVVGAGPIGLLIAVVARHAGADVAVVEPNERRRDVAAGLGLTTVDHDVEQWVESWTEGAGVEVAFEVSGTQAGMATATTALAARGRAVVVGIHPTPPHVDLFRVFWRELTLIGARVYERLDFEDAVRLLADDAIPSKTLISGVVPLADVQGAFTTMDEGAAMKLLLEVSPC